MKIADPSKHGYSEDAPDWAEGVRRAQTWTGAHPHCSLLVFSIFSAECRARLDQMPIGLAAQAADRGVGALRIYRRDDDPDFVVRMAAKRHLDAIANAARNEKAKAVATFRTDFVDPLGHAGFDLDRSAGHPEDAVRRTFYFTLRWTYRVATGHDLPLPELHALAVGVGLANFLPLNEFGKPRAARFHAMIRELDSLAFEPGERQRFSEYAFMLAAETTAMMTNAEGAPTRAAPSAQELVEEIRRTMLSSYFARHLAARGPRALSWNG